MCHLLATNQRQKKIECRTEKVHIIVQLAIARSGNGWAGVALDVSVDEGVDVGLSFLCSHQHPHPHTQSHPPTPHSVISHNLKHITTKSNTFNQYSIVIM